MPRAPPYDLHPPYLPPDQYSPLSTEYMSWRQVGPTLHQPPLVPQPYAQLPQYPLPLQQQVGPMAQQPPFARPYIGMRVPCVQAPPGCPLTEHAHPILSPPCHVDRQYQIHLYVPAHEEAWPYQPHPPGPPLQVYRESQPRPPVPYSSRQLPFMPPASGPAPGANKVTVSNTMNAGKGLHMAIDIARSKEASVNLGEDVLVLDTVTPRQMADVASPEEAAQDLEQWMQGPVGGPSCRSQEPPCASAARAMFARQWHDE